ACARMAPEVASAASSASAYLTRPSLESFERVTIALRCLWPTRSASVFGGRRVHDLCHRPASRCAAASGTRQRTAPTKGGGGCPARRRGLVTSADGDAPAGRDAAAGVTRTAPAMRHAAPSLQRCTVRMTAMWASRATRRARRARPTASSLTAPCATTATAARPTTPARTAPARATPRSSTALPATTRTRARERRSAGVCDLAESCTGTSAACPRDAKSTAECRPAAGPCDAAEQCDGSSDTCPPDAYQPATAECRPSTGVCDPAELCTGSSPTCSADVMAQDTDGDGVCDLIDDCPTNPDPAQLDSDGDGIGDACDPCNNIVPVFAIKQRVRIR